jgi:hypothetical protein
VGHGHGHGHGQGRRWQGQDAPARTHPENGRAQAEQADLGGVPVGTASRSATRGRKADAAPADTAARIAIEAGMVLDGSGAGACAAPAS